MYKAPQQSPSLLSKFLLGVHRASVFSVRFLCWGFICIVNGDLNFLGILLSKHFKLLSFLKLFFIVILGNILVIGRNGASISTTIWGYLVHYPRLPCFGVEVVRWDLTLFVWPGLRAVCVTAGTVILPSVDVTSFLLVCVAFRWWNKRSWSSQSSSVIVLHTGSGNTKRRMLAANCHNRHPCVLVVSN